MQGCGISATTRWVEVGRDSYSTSSLSHSDPFQAVKEAEWRLLHRPSAPEATVENNSSAHARRNWQRAVSVAKRAGGDDDLDQEPVSPTRNATRQSSGNLASQPAQLDLPPGTTAKMMDLQYFLELVDLKHRHGSNLRVYHSYWKNSTTAQNFFFWLDYGEGKDLDLPQCPRDKLERQQVRYLSREERMNYLVRVDEAGLFRWAKNNERVWTDNRRFKDSLKGVVHIDEDAPQFQGNTEAGDPDSFLTSSSSSVSSLSSSDYDSDSDMCVREAKETYVNEDYKAVKKLKKVVHVSPSTILSSIRGKSLKKEDMWIFVSFSISCIYYILTLACSGCRYLLSLVYRDQAIRCISAFIVSSRCSHFCCRSNQGPEWTASQFGAIEVFPPWPQSRKTTDHTKVAITVLLQPTFVLLFTPSKTEGSTCLTSPLASRTRSSRASRDTPEPSTKYVRYMRRLTT